MIRSWAPSRLHFGLIQPARISDWPDADGAPSMPGRAFGGVGAMITWPGVQVRCVAAKTWSADGPLADRALAVAERFRSTLAPGSLPPQRLVIEQAPPVHCGFGVGTQLALAIARALAAAADHEQWPAAELARRVGRGVRSAIGVHGFASGGFLVDGGKRDDDGIAPLIARVAIPPEWRWLLAWPPNGVGLHGRAEHAAFGRIPSDSIDRRFVEALCRIVVLSLLPAIMEADFETFSDALADYNARAGELFRQIQGDRYGSEQVGDIVQRFRRRNICAGQSSWGPLVFALFADEDSAQKGLEVVASLRLQYGIAESCNSGSEIKRE